MDVGALPATHVYKKVQTDKTYNKETDVFAWMRAYILENKTLFCFVFGIVGEGNI